MTYEYSARQDVTVRKVILIAHNIRSCHNVGALLRTADGLGIEKVYLTGYTPFPLGTFDARLPHLAAKIDAQIHKTALGAEKTVTWEHGDAIEPVLENLKNDGYTIAALEQDKRSVNLTTFLPEDKIALIAGREVEGVEPEVLAACDTILEIPMVGTKESYNVASAAAMALYHLIFSPFHLQ